MNFAVTFSRVNSEIEICNVALLCIVCWITKMQLFNSVTEAATQLCPIYILNSNIENLWLIVACLFCFANSVFFRTGISAIILPLFCRQAT